MHKIELYEVKDILGIVDEFHGPLPEKMSHAEFMQQSIVQFFAQKIANKYTQLGSIIPENVRQPSINPEAREKLREILGKYSNPRDISSLLQDIGSQAKKEAKNLVMRTKY